MPLRILLPKHSEFITYAEAVKGWVHAERSLDRAVKAVCAFAAYCDAVAVAADGDDCQQRVATVNRYFSALVRFFFRRLDECRILTEEVLRRD
jgi:hypothetical protein